MAQCSYSHAQLATMTDATGRSWCDTCKPRCDLVNYGHAHNWPQAYVHPYAIGNDQDLWMLNALVARDECVHTLLDGLLGTTDEEEAS